MRYPSSIRPARLTRRILVGLVMALALLSPIVEGAVPESVSPQPLIVAAVLIAAATAMLMDGKARWAGLTHRIGLALAAATLSITLFDLAARPALTQVVFATSPDRHIHPWRAMPLVRRFDPNVDETTRTYGDLAGITGRPELRDYREVRFVTDANGFRNAPPLPSQVDIVLLGDSFAMGGNTTQSQTLGTILRGEYGLAVYEIALPADGLWAEYVNLAASLDLIRAHPGTRVVWALYTGNDLIDSGPAITDIDQLPWTSASDALRVDYDVFRYRSPINRLASRVTAPRSTIDVVTPRAFLNGRTMLFYSVSADLARLDRQDVETHPNFASLVEVIHAMKQLADRRQLSVDIVILPTKDEVYRWVLDGGAAWTSDASPAGFSQAITALAGEEGMCALDLKPAFVEESRRVYEQSGQILWWYDDTHWNAEGNRLAAALVREMLDGDNACQNNAR